MILTKHEESRAKSKVHEVDLNVTSKSNWVKKTEHNKKMQHFADEISLIVFNGNYKWGID